MSPTIKQEMAAEKLVGNGGNVTKTMREVGYRENTVNTPAKLTDSKGFKEAAKPLVQRLKDELDRAIKQLKSKISKAKYRDLTDAIDKLHKNIRLLEGKSTDNFSVNDYSTKPDDELYEILQRKKSTDGGEGTGEKGTGEATLA